jgi:hypothetical protein
MAKSAKRRSDDGEEAAKKLVVPKVFSQMRKMLAHLHAAGTERDSAGNRKLFYDEYVMLLLLYFYNPTLTSLRGLQECTNWERVRKALGIQRTSMGSLSESVRLFDPELLRPIIQELASQALPHTKGQEAEALRGLTAVDGSVFSGVARMAWAMWKSAAETGVKLHLHYEVFTGVPCDAQVSPAACSEIQYLSSMLQPGRLYVMDRGYVCYETFAKIINAGSSLIGRVKDNTAFEVQEERVISEAARKAGVVRDAILSRLGTSHHKNHFKEPMRLVVVQTIDRDGKSNELWLITNRLDLDAELVALAYRYRWLVELFFRWLKCVLGARHLVSYKPQGVTIQIYAALIVSLLMALYTGLKPTKRIFETIQLYLAGWVTDEEFAAFLARQKKLQDSKTKK